MRQGFAILIVAASSVLTGCAVSHAVQSGSEAIQHDVDNPLGHGAVGSTNKSGSFTLYTLEEVDASNNIPVIKYAIVRTSDKRVVENGSVTMGVVKWSSEYEVEIAPAPGQPQLARGQNSTTRKIDLRKFIANPR